MNVVLPVVLVVLVVLVLRRKFPIARIIGPSMEPTYHQNNLVPCKRIHVRSVKQLTVGNIYIFRSPLDTKKLVIKRLVSVSKTECYFMGDNPLQSLDSRFYGYVPLENIVAEVIRSKDPIES